MAHCLGHSLRYGTHWIHVLILDDRLPFAMVRETFLDGYHKRASKHVAGN